MESPPPELDLMTVAQKDALIIALMQELAALQGQMADLQRQVRDLQAQLATNSRTSGKPPSSDGYAKPKPSSTRAKSGRKPGGQRGHKGATLERVAEPDHVVLHPGAGSCTGCGAGLDAALVIDTERRQVFDLPPRRVEVSEHQVPIKRCPCCAARCRGAFPAGVDHAVQYGPGIRAEAVYLSQYQLLPCARLAELFEDLYGLRLSQGTLDNFLARTGEGLADFETAAKTELMKSEVVHFDESGVRVGGKLHWLHVASTLLITCYLIHAKRGVEAMREMGVLGVFGGYAVHDHWSSYFSFEGQLHVACNAHHLRELIHAHEQHGQSWAERLIRCLLEAKAEVDAARAAEAGALAEARIDAIERRYRGILSRGRRELPKMPARAAGKRGRVKRHKVANLHARLVQFEPEALAFVYDFRLPFGRVGVWRGGPKDSVSTPRSSNRTCATNASGFRLRSIGLRAQQVGFRAWQPMQAQLAV